jgi:hypothetical protein
MAVGARQKRGTEHGAQLSQCGNGEEKTDRWAGPGWSPAGGGRRCCARAQLKMTWVAD